MSEAFDPYHSWLGVPPAERPADHYRLLGVQRFENDRDVIANAADRQMAFVQTFKTGKHSSDSQRLLNELASAKLVLTNPAKKAEYDAKLTAELAARANSLPPTPGVSIANPAATAAPIAAPPADAFAFGESTLPAISTAGSTASSRRVPSGGNPAVRIVGVIAGAVVGVAAAVLLLPLITGRSASVQRGKMAEYADRAGGSSNASASREKPAAIATTPPRPERHPADPPERRRPRDQSPRENAAPREDDSPRMFPDAASPAPEATASASPTAPTFTIPSFSELAKPSEEWIDLLAWTEGVDWKSRGVDWDAGLLAPPTRGSLHFAARLDNLHPLAAVVDGDYELEAEFTRRAGEDAVAVFFPVGVHNVTLELGAVAGKCDGINSIDRKRNVDNALVRRPSAVTTGKRHRVRIVVGLDGDRAKFNVDLDDRKDYIAWEGRLESLAVVGPFTPTTIRRPWVGAWNAEAEFHSVRLKSLKGNVKRDAITPEERRDQWDRMGLLRLVGETPLETQVGWGAFAVNQLPRDLPAPDRERRWPRVTPMFRYCDDYIGTHAPSRLVAKIPDAARSFSIVGVAPNSRSVKFLVAIDGETAYESPVGGEAVIRLAIPRRASSLELIVDPAGNEASDWAYWCFPRWRKVAVGAIDDALIDGPAGPLAFRVVPSPSQPDSKLRVNEPIGGPRPARRPIHFRDALPCDEFVFAHAASRARYAIPPGATRFTAVGHAPAGDVKFVVAVDGQEVYRSGVAGVLPIDVAIPAGSATLDLIVDPLGDSGLDLAAWCYPRLHR